MLYAAWTEGAKDSDITAIKEAMQSKPRLDADRTQTPALIPLYSPEFGTALSPALPSCDANSGKTKGM
jgi:hypothetical protein